MNYCAELEARMDIRKMIPEHGKEESVEDLRAKLAALHDAEEKKRLRQQIAEAERRLQRSGGRVVRG